MQNPKNPASHREVNHKTMNKHFISAVISCLGLISISACAVNPETNTANSSATVKATAYLLQV